MFPSTRFSPFQLRPLLRGALETDERVIGWGVAQKKPDGPQQGLILLASLLPGPGTLLAASLSTRISRFLILTDRRLLVTVPDPSATSAQRKGVTLDVPLSVLSVTALDQSGTFLLDMEGWPSPERMEVKSHDSDASSRLIYALTLLAQEESDRLDSGDGSYTTLAM
mgnify:CR=1 FL=1